jgi:hypothetical protein
MPPATERASCAKLGGALGGALRPCIPGLGPPPRAFRGFCGTGDTQNGTRPRVTRCHSTDRSGFQIHCSGDFADSVYFLGAVVRCSERPGEGFGASRRASAGRTSPGSARCSEVSLSVSGSVARHQEVRRASTMIGSVDQRGTFSLSPMDHRPGPRRVPGLPPPHNPRLAALGTHPRRAGDEPALHRRPPQGHESGELAYLRGRRDGVAHVAARWRQGAGPGDALATLGQPAGSMSAGSPECVRRRF